VLIRDAAYERLSKELRSDLHDASLPGSTAEGTSSRRIIGYHLEQAYRCIVELGPPGDRARRLAEASAPGAAAGRDRRDRP
jgi:hypothetical protein